MAKVSVIISGRSAPRKFHANAEYVNLEDVLAIREASNVYTIVKVCLLPKRIRFVPSMEPARGVTANATTKVESDDAKTTQCL